MRNIVKVLELFKGVDEMTDELKELLKVCELYKLKEVSRNNSNFYFCPRANIEYRRKETTAEHVYSCLKLADYFLSTKDFSDLDRLKVYELLMYHDDIEIDTEDVCISNRERRKTKDEEERLALPGLAARYPDVLKEKLIEMDTEFREYQTAESKFAHVIDKLDAFMHELKYPKDWGPRGFVEETVREWYGPPFSQFPAFARIFEELIKYLEGNGYFNVDI